MLTALPARKFSKPSELASSVLPWPPLRTQSRRLYASWYWTTCVRKHCSMQRRKESYCTNPAQLTVQRTRMLSDCALGHIPLPKCMNTTQNVSCSLFIRLIVPHSGWLYWHADLVKHCNLLKRGNALRIPEELNADYPPDLLQVVMRSKQWPWRWAFLLNHAHERGPFEHCHVMTNAVRASPYDKKQALQPGSIY